MGTALYILQIQARTNRCHMADTVVVQYGRRCLLVLVFMSAVARNLHCTCKSAFTPVTLWVTDLTEMLVQNLVLRRPFHAYRTNQALVHLSDQKRFLLVRFHRSAGDVIFDRLRGLVSGLGCSHQVDIIS